MTLLYGMHFGFVILSLLLGIVFAIIVVVATGQAGINPISLVTGSSQLVVGGALKNSGAALDANLMSNLVAGATSGSIAQQACELTTDFKIGFFLGTSPRSQWFGQLLGVLPTMFLGPGLFHIFAEAYPCIINLELAATCALQPPRSKLTGLSQLQSQTPNSPSPGRPGYSESWRQ
ncbi:hypothetical protein CEP52_016860 [Fusarium oligoseptatum]|uniref:Uncharacterized protein n=1 Tax=Fusarium oligoseptatum TaxID=2604345 RepID=A0A428RZ80_9HYPO|nr:hypothetical protein CEP52_016860 [Fusarium oligoseptatum]